MNLTHDTGEFGLSWKDEEGDDIVVSSNGELQAALEECPGAPNSTLKLNVTGKKNLIRTINKQPYFRYLSRIRWVLVFYFSFQLYLR